MCRHLKTLFCAIALLAMAHAQVFGVYHGYQCVVGGMLVQTEADHHHEGDELDSDHFVDFVPHAHEHGDHGHHHVHADDAGQGNDHEHDGAPKPHAPRKIELNATQASAPLPVPAVAVVELSELPDFLALAVQLVLEEERAILPPEWREGLSPPACLLVTHCMVLRV